MKNKTKPGDTFTIMCKSMEEKELKIAMMIEVARSGQYIGLSDFVWHSVAQRLKRTYRGIDYSHKLELSEKLEIKKE